MQRLLLVITMSFLSIFIFAQDEEDFTRKGKFMIETGPSFVSGLGASTGGSILFDDGNTLTQIAVEAGKFISEDFAIKFKLGILGGTGTTLTNISGGGKYYLGGIAPVEVDLGIVSGFGSTSFIGGAHIGYAFKAADNIYFEPKAGIIYSEESAVGSIKFSFALMF